MSSIRTIALVLSSLLLLSPVAGTVATAELVNGGTVDDGSLETTQGVSLPNATIQGTSATEIEVAYNVSEYVANGTVAQDDLTLILSGPNTGQVTPLTNTSGTVNVTLPAGAVVGGTHTFSADVINNSTGIPLLGDTAHFTDPSPVRVTEFTLSEQQVNKSEPVTVTATLNNTNQTVENFTVAVYSGSWVKNATNVSVAAGATKQVPLNMTFDYNGTYSIAVNNHSTKTLTVGDGTIGSDSDRTGGSDVTITATALNNTVVHYGDGYELTATLENPASTEQRFTFNYTLFDGVTALERSETVTVAANSTTNVTVNGSFPSVGKYSIRTENRDFYDPVVALPNGTTILVEDVRAMSATVNETMYFGATAHNYGATEDTRNVAVVHNGTVLDNQTVALGPGNETSLGFSVKFNEKGTYNVRVGNQTIPITVRSDPVVNASIEHLSGPRLEDGANATVSASLGSGLLQGEVDWRNATSVGSDLATVGATNETVFKIELLVRNFDPTVLIGTGHDANLTVTTVNATHKRIVLTVSPGSSQYLANASLENWPTGDADQATSMKQAGIDFAFDPMNRTPETEQQVMDGLVIMTDAQAYSAPEYEVGPNGEKRLTIRVAGPHLTVSGEVNTGYYETYLPPQLLADWGVENPDRLVASYQGETRTATATNTSDGGAYLTIPIHYSTGKVVVTKNSTSSETDNTTSETTTDGSDGSTTGTSDESTDDSGTVDATDDTTASTPVVDSPTSGSPVTNNDPTVSAPSSTTNDSAVGPATSPSVNVTALADGVEIGVSSLGPNETINASLGGGASSPTAAVNRLALNLSENVSNVTVDVSAPTTTAPDNTPAPSATTAVVSYFTVELGSMNDSDVESARFHVSVNQSALPNGTAPADVVVLRYHDGEWQQLETTSLGNGTYAATTPGFSAFAIATQDTAGQKATTTQTTTQQTTTTQTATAAETTTTSTSSPGFGLSVVALAVALLSLVALRRH